MSVTYQGVTYTNLTLAQIKLLNNYSGAMKKVDLAKILDDAISVVSSEIADDAITTSKILNLAVTTGKINNDAVTNAKLGTDVKAGSLAALTTVNKTSLQAAINEVNAALTGTTLRKYTISATVNVVADNTYVGDGFALAIPDECLLHGFFIRAAAPAGTAGGAKTIAYSVGTVQNADGDLTDGTDIDVMISTGDIAGVASVHGDQANDHVDGYFPMDMYARYFSAPTNLYLNYIGKSAGATGTPGTVTCSIEVYAICEIAS